VKRTLIAALAVALVAVPAFPCGGPGADIVDLPLVPTSEYLAHTLYDDDYEVRLRPELRLLEPFHAAMPDSVALVYEFLYESDGFPPDPAFDTTGARRAAEIQVPMLRAIERGAYVDAAVAARQVVSQVLDLPAARATVYGDALRNAVELIEVAPRLTPSDRELAARYFTADSATRQALAGTTLLPPVLRDAYEVRRLPRDRMGAYADAHPESPRAPSLRFVALQQAMRTGIPDGWAPIDSVPPERWAQLQRLHNEWLRQYPSHPLADYVRFSNVRLFYLQGREADAWNELLSVYPRHRERVLGEMTYLVRKSALPSSLDDPRIDWPLRASLLAQAPVTAQAWTRYWKASEAHVSEPWALPAQERLLWRAIDLVGDGDSLPQGFPARAAAPTPLWAKLRLLVLLEAGDVAGAFAQADSTDPDPDVEAIRVRLHLIRRDWGGALRAAPNGDPATAYLVRVLAPPAVVDSLAAARRSPLANDARLALAGRRAAAGDWAGASRAAAAIGHAKARLWARTAALAADTSRAGRLAFARWMRSQNGQLFFGENIFWFRGLNWRLYAIARDTSDHNAEPPRLDPRLPWTPEDEGAKIAAHLQSTTELYYALQSYARWLDGATARTPGVAAVVREADQVYNRLINLDANNSRFWENILGASSEARSIRRAGALLRRSR
jgi:hypothetical protein